MSGYDEQVEICWDIICYVFLMFIFHMRMCCHLYIVNIVLLTYGISFTEAKYDTVVSLGVGAVFKFNTIYLLCVLCIFPVLRVMYFRNFIVTFFLGKFV